MCNVSVKPVIIVLEWYWIKSHIFINKIESGNATFHPMYNSIVFLLMVLPISFLLVSGSTMISVVDIHNKEMFYQSNQWFSLWKSQRRYIHRGMHCLQPLLQRWGCVVTTKSTPNGFELILEIQLGNTSSLRRISRMHLTKHLYLRIMPFSGIIFFWYLCAWVYTPMLCRGL